MVTIARDRVEAFIAKPDPAQPIVLVYGADAGLVRERTEALIRASVDDVSDPFSLARLEGDLLAADPSRLVEEANTVPLFGGRRAVWIKAGTRSFVPAVEALIAALSPDCRVVIEAGELRKNAPLRVICERAKTAAVVACYADAGVQLDRLIDTEMREAGLTIAPTARAALVPLLGGDRLASRSELRKLALYARGKTTVELEDITAVVADASVLALDALVDAVFAGRMADLEFHYVKARNAGTSAGAILFAVSRHVSGLHKARLSLDRGQPVRMAVEAMWLHSSRAPLAQAAVKAWPAQRLEKAMLQLADATLESRRNADLADAIVRRALMELAIAARRSQTSNAAVTGTWSEGRGAPR